FFLLPSLPLISLFPYTTLFRSSPCRPARCSPSSSSSACGARLAGSERYALFGHPVSHSRSPDVHRAFAAQTGRDVQYELIDVAPDRKSTRLNSSHVKISYAVFC